MHDQKGIQRQIDVAQLMRPAVQLAHLGQLMRNPRPEQHQPIGRHGQAAAIDIVDHFEINREIRLDMAVPMRLIHHHGFKDAHAKAAKGAVGGVEVPLVAWRRGAGAGGLRGLHRLPQGLILENQKTICQTDIVVKPLHGAQSPNPRLRNRGAASGSAKRNVTLTRQ